MKGFVDAVTGFAADEEGSGVAYVRLQLGGSARVLRVPFRVRRYPALRGREVGYAALTAVGETLRGRNVQRVRFILDDAQLRSDLREHRDVPAPLTVAYVRLRCVLNGFQAYEVAPAGDAASDLTARARSEIAMHVAA